MALDKSAMGGRAYGVRACVLKLLLQQLNGSHVTLMYRTVASRDLNVSAAQGVVCKAQNPGQRAQPWSVCVYGVFLCTFYYYSLATSWSLLPPFAFRFVPLARSMNKALSSPPGASLRFWENRTSFCTTTVCTGRGAGKPVLI